MNQLLCEFIFLSDMEVILRATTWTENYITTNIGWSEHKNEYLSIVNNAELPLNEWFYWYQGNIP
jgi:hypothetical protein